MKRGISTVFETAAFALWVCGCGASSGGITSDQAVGSIVPDKVTTSVGETGQAYCTSQDKRFTGCDWTIDNSGIATVSKGFDPRTGNFRGVAIGTTTARVSFTGTAVTGSIPVDVVPYTISLDPIWATLVAGNTQTFLARVTMHDRKMPDPTNVSLTWTSTPSSVALLGLPADYIDGVQAQTIRARDAGTATLTVTNTAAGGGTASAPITVTLPPAVSGNLTCQPNSIAVNATSVCSITSAQGAAIPAASATWKSDNSLIATVNASGTVTGVGTGTAVRPPCRTIPPRSPPQQSPVRA